MKPSNLRPFFAYLSEAQYSALKHFSQKNGVPMTQVVRESIESRLSSGDLFVAGYNQGLQDAISAINRNNISKMTFPSGRTFGELIIEDISAFIRNDGAGSDQVQQEATQEAQGNASEPGAAA